MPGKEVVILGSGDIGLIMARRMTLEGAKVKVVAELMPYSGGLKRNIVQCLNDFDIPLKLSHTVVDIEGKDRVKAVTIAEVGPDRRPIPGTEERYECDTLLLSCGLIPENELSKSAGVDLSPITSGPIVNDSLETNIDGVFACGNVLHVHDLVDFVSQEAEALANGVAAYLKEGTLTECGLTVETCPVIGHVIPQKVSGTQDFSLSFRVRRPMGKCRIEVRQGDTVLTTVKLPKAIPAEMIQFTVPCKEMTADRNVEVFVDEV